MTQEKTDYKEYKHLAFRKLMDKPKTTVWEFYNKSNMNDCLGLAKWYPQWRQYCSHFFYVSAFSEIVFSAGCHRDMADFIDQLMNARK